uniref:Uncharacterized protein n=2 Tax=Brassica oleracea TaxID=3712 RepID=A0A0D3BM47_BRAOL|nr:unnamed protein product [Brassica oleracea]
MEMPSHASLYFLHISRYHFSLFFCCSLQGHLHQSTSVPCVGHSRHMSDSVFGSVISLFFLGKMGLTHTFREWF